MEYAVCMKRIYYMATDVGLLVAAFGLLYVVCVG